MQLPLQPNNFRFTSCVAARTMAGMSIDAPGNLQDPRTAGPLAMATACAGGVLIAIVIGALLYAFVRLVAA
jgi:hypothetical protein